MSQVDKIIYIPLLFWFIILILILYFIIFTIFLSYFISISKGRIIYIQNIINISNIENENIDYIKEYIFYLNNKIINILHINKKKYIK